MDITYVATDCVCEMTETPGVVFFFPVFFFFVKAHTALHSHKKCSLCHKVERISVVSKLIRECNKLNLKH